MTRVLREQETQMVCDTVATGRCVSSRGATDGHQQWEDLEQMLCQSLWEPPPGRCPKTRDKSVPISTPPAQGRYDSPGHGHSTQQGSKVCARSCRRHRGRIQEWPGARGRRRPRPAAHERWEPQAPMRVTDARSVLVVTAPASLHSRTESGKRDSGGPALDRVC